MAESKHTPLPWSVSAFDTTTVIAIGDGPDRKGRAYRDGRHQYTVSRAGSPDEIGIYERVANAALIVKAAGYHERLVAALREAREFNLRLSSKSLDVWLRETDALLAELDEPTRTSSDDYMDAAMPVMDKSQ